MRKFVRRVVMLLSALLLVVSLAILIATQLIDIDDYREAVAAALTERVQLDVRIEGALELAPSLWPTISVKELLLYNPNTSRWRRPVARIGKLTLKADGLRSLRSRKLILSSAQMEDAELLLVRGLDGSANWQIDADVELADSSAEPTELSLEVGAVEVRDLVIRYDGRPSGLGFMIELDEMQMRAVSTVPPRRITLALEGRYEREDFSLQGSVEWDDDQPILVARGDHRLTLDARLAETSIQITGSLRDPRGDARADLKLVVRAESLSPLKRRLRILETVDLTGLGPAEATAHLVGGDGRVGLEAIAVQIRGERDETLHLSGAIHDLTSERRIRADLRIETHDTARWAERFGLPSPSLGKGQGSAVLHLDAAGLRLNSVQLTLVHREGARVKLEGDLVRAGGAWSGDVGLHIDADSAGQALDLVDETIRRVAHQERASVTLPGAYVLTSTDQALLRIGPATVDARLVEERGGWGLHGLELSAGHEGRDWLHARGEVARVIPEISGIEVRLEAGSDDLLALGQRIGIQVPRVDRLRASGTLRGDPDALRLDELQLVVARGDRLSIGVNGDLALHQDLSDTELKLSVSARDLAELGAVFDRSLWHAGPLELRAHIEGGRDRLFARAIRLRLGDSRLAGDLEWVRGHERPQLVATLDSERIHLRDFGFEPERDAEAARSGAVDFWNQPLPIQGSGEFDLRVALRADRISGREGFDLQDLSLHGSLGPQRVRLADLSMTWDGGRVYVTAEVDGRESPPVGSLRAWVDAAEVKQVLAQLTREDLGRGLVDVRIDLRSRGETLAAMLGRMDGKLVFYGREGTVAGKYSRALQLEILPRELKDPELGDFERINCIIAHLEASQGKVELESVLFDTPEQQVLASGRIDFAERTLNVLLTPAFKQTIPGRVTAAVRIHGSIDDPRVTPEPLSTAGLAAQAIVERALEPVRRWLPRVGEAIDEARRDTNWVLDATGVPVTGQIWVPGVDITCEKFLAQESVASALAARPAAPDTGL
ncbi:MAG: AsmA family protein [Deltaproteobacteria bacterium]|nr:AsmA family protein [Deltaproteobacteria bacterium]